MDEEDIRKIVGSADSYDEAREDSVLRIGMEFYSRRMRLVALVVWVNALIGIGIGVVAAVLFFRAGDVKQEIMYATICVGGMLWLAFAKIVGAMAVMWNNLRREIKRLEIRLADVAGGRSQSKA